MPTPDEGLLEELRLEEMLARSLAPAREPRGVGPFLREVAGGMAAGGLPGAAGAIAARTGRQAAEDRSILERQGIGFEGATTGERFTAALGVEDVDAYQRVLSQRFGRPVTVRREEQTGRLVFTDPTTGRTNTVTGTPGNISIGDIASIVPDALVGAAGAAGAFGGAAGGPLAGAAAGALIGGTAAPILIPPSSADPQTTIGIGAMTGAAAGATLPSALPVATLAAWGAEFGRLVAGQAAGAVDPNLDWMGLLRASMPAAAMEFGAGATGAAAYRLFRAYAGRVDPGTTLEEFNRRWTVTEQELAGTGADPTTAQAMRGTAVGDALLSQQGRLAGQPGDQSRMLREHLYRAEDAVVGQEPRLAAATGTDRTGQTPEIAGALLRGSIQAEHNAAVDAIEADMRAAIRDAPAPRRAGETVAETGQSLRGAFGNADRQLSALAEERFTAVRRSVGDVTGEADNAARFVQGETDMERRLLAPGVTDEDRAFLRGALDRVSQEVRNEAGEVARDEAGSVIRATRTVSYADLDATISSLRNRIREAGGGPAAAQRNPSVPIMQRFVSALEADRAAMLTAAGREDALEVVRAAGSWYAQQNTRLRRALTEDVLATLRGGTRNRIPDEAVFARLNRRDADARLVAELADDPQYQAQLAPVRESMRDGFRQQFLTLAQDERGLVNARGHARFMREHGDRLPLWFSPEEIAQFERPGQAILALRQREQRFRQLIGPVETDAATGRMADDLDPTPRTAFRWSWSNTPDPERVRRVTGALTMMAQAGDDAPLRAYRGAILNDVRQSILTEAGSSPTGRARIDADAIRRYLDTHGDGLQEALGREYRQGLETLERQVRIVTAEPSTAVRADLRAPAIRHLVRAYLGQFTRPGRALTSAIRMSQDQADAAIRHMLLDPEVFRTVLRRATPITPDQFARIVASGAFGAEAAEETLE